MSHSENIFPIYDQLIQRTQKESLLKQHSCAIWMTGLSGSGKSTIALSLEKKLFAEGYLTQVLDGDNIRNGLNKNIGFSEEDRVENIRRIAEVSKLFVQCGVVTINCFVSPTKASRAQAKEIIGASDFIEVFINTPLEICEQRDVKGLYAKARRGEIKDFTGIHQAFEAPISPDLEIKTAENTIDTCVEKIYLYLIQKIKPI